MGQRIDPTVTNWFEDKKWDKRLLIFNDVGDNVELQLELLNSLPEELEDRDILLVQLTREGSVSNTAKLKAPPMSGSRKRFGIPESEYQMVLVGKDGRVKRRYNALVQPEEIFACIDSMPMRIREMQGLSEKPDDSVGLVDSKLLFDFSDENDIHPWFLLLDGVMGGKSTGNLSAQDGVLTFSGQTSLENNGGFSSIQSTVPRSAMEQMDSFKIKLKGDGRKWILAARKFDTPTADDYWASFETSGHWEEVVIPVSTMRRRVYGFRMFGSIKPEEIKGISFYMYDKNAGPFELQLKSLWSLKNKN